MAQESATLSSKLQQPYLRPDRVEREALVEQIRGQSHCKVILLVAPAGSGKTTLAASWAEAQGDAPVAWLSLDPQDDDLWRLLRHLFLALQKPCPEVGDEALAMLDAFQPSDQIMTAWLNELRELPQAPSLILDDLHQLAEPQAYEALGFLLEHWPSPGRVVLTTRSQPPLPLSRWRARAQLLELDEKKLRFSPQETTRFFHDTMKLSLDADTCEALHQHTEGWIAGLQLAGISLEHHHEPSALLSDALKGNRYILDYLREEVLQHQPEELRSFLLQTSILPGLNASLCDAVTGRDDSHLVLQQLERAHLFLSPTDLQRRGFRYHPMFAELLHQHARRELGDALHRAHRSASLWFEGEGALEQATIHAIQAQQLDRAAALVERRCATLVRENRWSHLRSCLGLLPQDAVDRSFSLSFYALAASCMSDIWGSREDRLLQELREGLSPEDDDLKGKLAWIQCHRSWNQKQLQQSQHHAREALAHLGPQSVELRAQLLSMVGFFEMQLDPDLRGAREKTQAILDALVRDQRGSDAHIYTVWRLAWIELRMGEPHSAHQRCLQLLAEVEPQNPGFLAPIHGMLANIAWEWGQLEDSQQHLKQALEHADGELGWGWNQYVHILQAVMQLHLTGDAKATKAALQKAKSSPFPGTPTALEPASVMEAALQLELGQLAAADRWAKRSGVALDAPLDDQHEMPNLVNLGILLSQKRLQEASEWLDVLLPFAQNNHRIRTQIELLLIRAQTQLLQEDPPAAEASILEAIELAAPGEFVRVFLDKHRALGALYQEILEQPSQRAPHFLSSLSEALGAAPPPQAWPRRKAPPKLPALEVPLSKRELEILQHAAKGMVNREMAKHLHISPETVKSHLKKIYQKLEVNNRTQAVSKAFELQLLQKDD